PARYEIRAEGVLGEDWSAWFDGLQAASDGTGTVISGVVPDQPALHGPLNPGPRSWPVPDLGAPDQMTAPNTSSRIGSSERSSRGSAQGCPLVIHGGPRAGWSCPAAGPGLGSAPN